MNNIVQNYQSVEARVAAACQAAGRARSEVRLVAVCKNFTAEDVRQVAALGQVDFGENRLQEAEPKIEQLQDLNLRWHFLGQIQSNKLTRILKSFDMIQSIDRIQILNKTHRYLRDIDLQRDALLEVCISDEGTKSGFDPAELSRMIAQGSLQEYKGLRFRGLMGIAPHVDGGDRSKIQRAFAQLKTLYDEGRSAGHDWDTLSMGMSSDLEEAIAAGSTMVRVGTAIFGDRD